MTKPTHYLRFVQAVILAAAVPACTASSDDPKPSPQIETAQQSGQTKTEESKPDEQTTEEAKTEEPKAEPLDGTGKPADAGLPFSSGPLMPPVLPSSFA
jgi:hypothetical protein